MLQDTDFLLMISLIFFLAGMVKGVIGMGLPSVSLGLLASIMDLQTAIALTVLPTFVTNIWQAFAARHQGLFVIRRIWLFLLVTLACIWFGVMLLASINPNLLSALLGLLLIAYGLVNLAGYQLTFHPRQDRWLAPLCGLASGLSIGMTGSSVMPGVLYLQAIGLNRDQLIQAMGLLFSLSAVALGIAMNRMAIMTGSLNTLSALALLPAFMGMFAGGLIRKRLSEQRFRQVFFYAILALGAYILARAGLTL